MPYLCASELLYHFFCPLCEYFFQVDMWFKLTNGPFGTDNIKSGPALPTPIITLPCVCFPGTLWLPFATRSRWGSLWSAHTERYASEGPDSAFKTEFKTEGKLINEKFKYKTWYTPIYMLLIWVIN